MYAISTKLYFDTETTGTLGAAAGDVKPGTGVLSSCCGDGARLQPGGKEEDVQSVEHEMDC